MKPIIVHISWPDDPERGFEVYGPFADHDAANAWVDQCMHAADDGWQLLKRTHYHVLPLVEPFDPTSLWEINGDAARG